MPDLDIAPAIEYKREQFRARNAIVAGALRNSVDWILMLDDDMEVPQDLVKRLMAHDKDVCGVLYYQRGGAYHPVVLDRIGDPDGEFKTRFWLPYDQRILNPGLYRCDIIGGACMLFKASVFERMLQPWFHPELDTGTDIAICNRIAELGYEIWVDTSIQLGHYGNKQLITSNTVPMGERLMAQINETLYFDLMEYLGMTRAQFDLELKAVAQEESRADKWNAKKRETWEDIKDYYTSFGNWHVINLGYWALNERSIFKEWALDHNNPLIKSGGTYLDFGAGVGHLAFGLAMQKQVAIHCLDIARAPTLDFISWRRNKYCESMPGEVWLLPFDTEDIGHRENGKDGIFCISVIDHLTKPYESILWMRDQLKPGGFLVLDYMRHTNDHNPQHLDRYDVATMDQWMNENGWRTSVEYPWLFFKRGDDE